MIDHIGFAVADAEQSRIFYEKALAPLGLSVVMSMPAGVTEAGGATHGFGRDGKPEFWVGAGATPGRNAHIAFSADRRAEVDAFHAAAVAAGGRDNGAPGLRPHYTPTYYAAFVIDPDGNNVEVVCRAAE